MPRTTAEAIPTERKWNDDMTDEKTATREGEEKVTALDRYIPPEVRRAAIHAYRARLKYEDALHQNVDSMRALARACRKYAVAPGSLAVAGLPGDALVPAQYTPGPCGKFSARYTPETIGLWPRCACCGQPKKDHAGAEASPPEEGKR